MWFGTVRVSAMWSPKRGLLGVVTQFLGKLPRGWIPGVGAPLGAAGGLYESRAETNGDRLEVSLTELLHTGTRSFEAGRATKNSQRGRGSRVLPMRGMRRDSARRRWLLALRWGWRGGKFVARTVGSSVIKDRQVA